MTRGGVFLFLVLGCTGTATTGLAQSLLSTGFAPSGEPAGNDFVQVASTMLHSVARRTDGSIVAWGDNAHGQCNVPPLPSGLVYTDVGAGTRHTIALRSDGSCIGFGDNSHGQCNPPALPAGVTLRDVSAWMDWNLGLRSDGRVIVWGANTGTSLYSFPTTNDFVAIAQGTSHALALRGNGTIAAWGNNYDGQLWVPSLPPGVVYTAIAAANMFSSALRSDGQVVSWGSTFGTYGVGSLPPPGAGRRYVRITSGLSQIVAWRDDGQVFVAGSAWYWYSPPPVGHDHLDVAWSYNHVHWLHAPHVAATYSTLGLGCPGTAGLSHVNATEPPRLGTTFTCTADHVPTGLCVMLSGLDAASSPFGPLPIDLTPLGMNGCLGHIRTDIVQVATAPNGSASFPLSIPWQPALVGVRFYQQALLPDPGANPAGMVLSDAKVGVVGPY